MRNTFIWAAILASLTTILSRPTNRNELSALVNDLFARQQTDNSTSTSSNNNASDWTFVETVLNQTSFTAQPYVSNGYIGARLPAAGVGFQSFNPDPNNPKALGQGWPIFGPRVTASMVAGFYDLQNSTIGTNFPQTGGEQVISLLPSWPQLYFTIRNSTDNSSEATYAPGIDSNTIKNFTQSLSIRNGTVITEVQWQPEGYTQPINLRYTVIAHRKRAPLGLMQLQVSGLSNGTSFVITDALDGQAAARTQNGTSGKTAEQDRSIYSTVEPNGVSNVTAYVFSALQGDDSILGSNTSLPTSVGKLIGSENASTITQSYEAQFDGRSQTINVWKAVGIASSDAFGAVARQTALSATQQARVDGWDSLINEHVQEWEEEWNDGGDIVIQDQSTPLLRQLQRQARASLFHILSNVRRGSEGPGLGDNSIAPAGLTSDSYAGSIFWDAETFMFPSLSLLYPQFAESMLNYRSKVPDQLEKNAQQYGKPGILYPWVSARYQNCTGIGPCYDYEYHLNNDIALAHWQYYLQTNNQTFLENQAWPIMEGVSRFWAAQVTPTPANETLQDGNNTANPPAGVRQYVTLNLTDPDEYANHKNNGAFTNAGLTTVMLDTLYAASLLNKSIDSLNAQNWSTIANEITLLRENSSNIVLEYEGFNSTVEVKQADVPLLIYPLEYNREFPDREPAPRSDLNYYSEATDPSGPGMTYSIYGIAATQLDGDKKTFVGPSCEGFTRLLQAGLPYERQFGQFSEQINDDYRTNGGSNPAGGVNPAFTFLTGHGGLLQMYTHGFLGYRARNSTDNSMFIDPNLPPQLSGGLTIRGVHHGDSILDVELGNTTTTITHRNGTSPVSIQTNNGTQSVQVGQSIQVSTRTINTFEDSNSGNQTNFALCTAIDDGSEANVTDTTSSAEITSMFQAAHTGTNVAFGANDGSNATYYQPVLANQSSSLLIDLGKVQTLSKVHLNFGTLPPQFVSLSISEDNAQTNQTSNANSTSSAYRTIIDRMAINITAPYDANDNAVKQAIVQLPNAWNVTDIDLTNSTSSSNSTNGSSSLQARYVNLTMEGVATPQSLGEGATLLEIQMQ